MVLHSIWSENTLQPTVDCENSWKDNQGLSLPSINLSYNNGCIYETASIADDLSQITQHPAASQCLPGLVKHLTQYSKTLHTCTLQSCISHFTFMEIVLLPTFQLNSLQPCVCIDLCNYSSVYLLFCLNLCWHFGCTSFGCDDVGWIRIRVPPR